MKTAMKPILVLAALNLANSAIANIDTTNLMIDHSALPNPASAALISVGILGLILSRHQQKS